MGLLDFAVFSIAFLPLAVRVGELGLDGLILDIGYLLDWRWWACVGGIGCLYGLHGFIWNFPARFAALCKKYTKLHPVEVFAVLEGVGKIWQGGAVALYLGTSGLRAAGAAMAAAPAWCWAACAASVAAGQTLNFAMYATIGNAGVYYGFKLGRPVPWATAFPFNVGLRHPQYVGVVLTILGLATTQLSHATAAAGLPQVAAAWAAMYVVMAAMEEVGDNDKSSKKAPTPKPAAKAKAAPKPSPKPKAATPKSSPAPSPKRAAKSPARSKTPKKTPASTKKPKKTPAKSPAPSPRRLRSPSKRIAKKKD